MDVKPIRVKSEEEFERLCDRIDKEVSHARHHWDLLKNLEDSRAEYWREMNESNTFWHLTFIAHRDSVLAHLGRLYDDTNGSLSLSHFLETVRANRGFFTDENRHLVDSDLAAEQDSVSPSNPLVKELHSIRHKAIAHTDADAVRRGAPEARKRWLPPDEIEVLIDRASSITGKYNLFFRQMVHGGIAGHDDFKSTLGWIRKGLEANDAEMQREYDTLRQLSQH
jgi:hypothetical protein